MWYPAAHHEKPVLQAEISMEKVTIFDTTLRDGQQCPGAGMSFENNLRYAHLAAKVGIDVLEAGFPSASKLDFEIVQAIAYELRELPSAPIICALCQLRDEQIDRTIEALGPVASSGLGRLHVYVPVDPNLMEVSLGELSKDKEKIITLVRQYCQRAKAAGLEVEFSPEGYSRMGENFSFVSELILASIEGGASVINCPDTIGGASPYQGDDYFVNDIAKHADLAKKHFPNSEINWSVHCHNDLGLAVTNSIEAVFNGPCRQIEGCINGIGERAGNAALEQCIMVIDQFGREKGSGFMTGIQTESLQEISNFVAEHMLPRQPHSPITGANAAKHSSGGHTNAVLKNPLVYQPFDPNRTGKSVSLIFGPLSGGNHAQSIIHEAGYRCTNGEKAAIAQFIKDCYSERRKGVTDEEVLCGYFLYRSPIKIEEFEYLRSKDAAEIIIRGSFFSEEGELRERVEGKDSALAGLKKLVDKFFPDTNIERYHSDSVGTGVHASSVSVIELSLPDGRRFEGKGEDFDIAQSAMKALSEAVNKAFVEKNFREGA